MVTRPLPASIAIALGAAFFAGCSPAERSSLTAPTAITEPALSNSIASGLLHAAAFPPRNEPFLFRTNLESKYRDGLHREATARTSISKARLSGRRSTCDTGSASAVMPRPWRRCCARSTGPPRNQSAMPRRPRHFHPATSRSTSACSSNRNIATG